MWYRVCFADYKQLVHYGCCWIERLLYCMVASASSCLPAIAFVSPKAYPAKSDGCHYLGGMRMTLSLPWLCYSWIFAMISESLKMENSSSPTFMLCPP